MGSLNNEVKRLIAHSLFSSLSNKVGLFRLLPDLLLVSIKEKKALGKIVFKLTACFKLLIFGIFFPLACI